MSVVKAVFKRNVAAFFGNPAGYVFIILFVGMTAWFAFVTDEFFANNQANLNPLTYRMPWLLMIFVAAVTMSTWAEEKKLGTDELLFTLPSGDLQVVAGKFLANLAVFTASLAFTLSHVLILMHLGDPDIGRLFATYLGYWLMGAAFIATGMFASSLTNNLTVGFILGALFCAVFAFAQVLGAVMPGRVGTGFEDLAAITHLETFTRGVAALDDVVYFASIVGAMLFLNSVVLSRRRWPGGLVAAAANPKLHAAVRIAAVIVIAASANVLVARLGARADITEEGLSSLSGETKQILSELSADKPVYIQAWISEDVPGAFIQTRDTLLGLLREYDERGGDAVRVKIYHPERYSQEARDAKEKFDIQPQVMPVMEGAESSVDEIFAGAVFTCGVEEKVIPFFHPGIPIEYELTRTIREVTKTDRPKVGVVENELKLFGGFNFETYSQSKRWDIVEELTKQYDVDTVRADSPIPEDVDVIIAALPSLLTDENLDNLIGAIRSGKPALLFCDPLPYVDLRLSPKLPRPSPSSNPMMGARQPPGEPKGDISRLMNLLGVGWPNTLIVWDIRNPHPELRHFPPEFVFVTDSGRAEGEEAAAAETARVRGFNPNDPVTAGLQEILALFPGTLRPGMAPEGTLTFEPLITTEAGSSGVINWDNVVTQSFFGPMVQPFEMLTRLPRRPLPQEYVLAARIRGELPAAPKRPADEAPPVPEEAFGDEAAPQEGDESAAAAAADEPGAGDAAEPAAAGAEGSAENSPPATSKIDVILVADLDMVSDLFFQIRQAKWKEFDNVTFVLNAVDSLAGDDSYISLRKKRRQFRTLTTIEDLERQYREGRMNEENAAEMDAQQKLAEAQASFDEKVRAVEERTDLDARAKDVMIASVRRVEEDRLAAKKAKIDEEKNKRLEAAHFAMQESIRDIHMAEKAKAVVFPIIPPLIIAILVFFIRRSRENLGESKSRLLRD